MNALADELITELRRIDERLARLETRLDSSPTAAEISSVRAEIAVIQARLDAHERACATAVSKAEATPGYVSVGAAGGIGAILGASLEFIIRNILQ